MENTVIEVAGTPFHAVRVQFGHAPFLVIWNERGYLACGYLNREAAERFHDVAAVVSGVKTFDDVLEASLVWVSTAAHQLGARVGMKGREYLTLLSR